MYIEVTVGYASESVEIDNESVLEDIGTVDVLDWLKQQNCERLSDYVKEQAEGTAMDTLLHMVDTADLLRAIARKMDAC